MCSDTEFWLTFRCASVYKIIIGKFSKLVQSCCSSIALLLFHYILDNTHSVLCVLTLLTLAVLLNLSVTQRASVWSNLLLHSPSDPALSDVRSLISELQSDHHSLYLLSHTSLTCREGDNDGGVYVKNQTEEIITNIKHT